VISRLPKKNLSASCERALNVDFKKIRKKKNLLDEKSLIVTQVTRFNILHSEGNVDPQGMKKDGDDIDQVDDNLSKLLSHTEISRTLGVLNQGVKFYGSDFDLHYSYMKCLKNMVEDSRKPTKIFRSISP